MKKLMAKDAQEAQQIIERTAKENMVSNIRRIEKMEVGKVVRQGDIYIHRVADTHERGDLQGSRQLAPGESMGSRHVAELPAEVYQGKKKPEWYSDRIINALLGPCIVSLAPFKITHPEHAHVELPAGTYQITHQMDGKTRQRALD